VSALRDKVQKFLDTMDSLPPSLTAFRGMLAVAFVVGASSYANGDVDDKELQEMARECLDQFDSWKGN